MSNISESILRIGPGQICSCSPNSHSPVLDYCIHCTVNLWFCLLINSSVFSFSKKISRFFKIEAWDIKYIYIYIFSLGRGWCCVQTLEGGVQLTCTEPALPPPVFPFEGRVKKMTATKKQMNGFFLFIPSTYPLKRLFISHCQCAGWAFF